MREKQIGPTGVLETLDYHDDGTVSVRMEEDVESLLDRCKNAANQGLTDHGIRGGLWHHSSVPVTVIYEMMKKGIDFYHKDHQKRVDQEIESNYPYLKTTSKRLVIPPSYGRRRSV